jgi:hypothetical protein
MAPLSSATPNSGAPAAPGCVKDIYDTNLGVRLRSPSARSPIWQTTRSMGVPHAESALVRRDDTLGHRTCQNQRKYTGEPADSKPHQPYGRARQAVSWNEPWSVTHLLRCLPSGRPSWQNGATLGATPRGYTGNSGRAEMPYFTGLSRSHFKVAEREGLSERFFHSAGFPGKAASPAGYRDTLRTTSRPTLPRQVHVSEMALIVEGRKSAAPIWCELA